MIYLFEGLLFLILLAAVLALITGIVKFFMRRKASDHEKAYDAAKQRIADAKFAYEAEKMIAEAQRVEEETNILKTKNTKSNQQ